MFMRIPSNFGACMAIGVLLVCGCQRMAPPVPGQAYTAPETGIEMVYVGPGTFTMGDRGQSGNSMDLREVTLTKPFWIGRYEVTEKQFCDFTGTNTTKVLSHPRSGVSWVDARDFCRALTEQERSRGRLPEGYEYRLPSEAEWEYAARGGPAQADVYTAGPDPIAKAARTLFGDGNRFYPVGKLPPNSLGLYDLDGNVSEWCFDVYDKYFYGEDPMTDPVCRTGSAARVHRGRWWLPPHWRADYGIRAGYGPRNASPFTGFRLCLGPIIPPLTESEVRTNRPPTHIRYEYNPDGTRRRVIKTWKD